MAVRAAGTLELQLLELGRGFLQGIEVLPHFQVQTPCFVVHGVPYSRLSIGPCEPQTISPERLPKVVFCRSFMLGKVSLRSFSIHFSH